MLCKVHVIYIEDIQWIGVEYGNYFTSKTGFLIFLLYYKNPVSRVK